MMPTAAAGEQHLEGRVVGVDELPDDGRRRGEQRQTDDAQEQDDVPGDVGVGVVAHIPDVPAIAEADRAHGERDDPEENADPVIHGFPLFRMKCMGSAKHSAFVNSIILFTG